MRTLVLALAALSGCGSAQVADRPAATPAPMATLVATLGDSITAGTPAWDPDPGVREPIGTGADPRSQWQYWAHREQPRLRFRNCGVNRERTDQILARFDACARGASAIVIQGGINDIAQGIPLETAARNLDAMATKAQQRHMRIAIAEVLPWNNGYPDADPLIQSLNQRIHSIARRHRARVLPFYETLEDPSNPGRMPARWTYEGDHPSIAGYRRLGSLYS